VGSRVVTGIGSWVVIESFYKLRAAHGGPGKPDARRTPKKMIADAQAYADWCSEKGVDAIAFMRGRFEHVAATTKKWPSIRALKSESALEAWSVWREGVALEQRAAERLMAENRADCDDPMLAQRVRHLAVLTPALAMMHRQYRAEGREHLCEGDQHFSGGYDPRDVVCRTCPRKVGCLAKLNAREGFDVGALRAGAYQALPAQVRRAATAMDERLREVPSIAHRAA
jgi:hypothetical protein